MPDRCVIIDTDPGVDDALALLLAAASPELEVVAVTTVGGNVDLEQVTENARRVVAVAWAGGEPPPIYRGATAGSPTAAYVFGEDGLGGAALLRDAHGAHRYPPEAPLADGTAAEAIVRLARQHPGELTVIALGPLTNVALALRQPGGELPLRRLVVMGGAFREPGNVTPVAEFNTWADPEAAQVVCESGLPMTWVPLDVTHRCLLGEHHLAGLPEVAACALARDCCAGYLAHHEELFGERSCFLHDPLAVGAVLWPELLRTRPLRVDVETEGCLTRGMTVADFRPGRRESTPPNAEVALEVDADAFVERFLARLAGRADA